VSVGFNWAGYHEYAATRLHHPSTLEQLQQIVAATPKIRALGTRHSFNDLADSAELVSVFAMDPAIEIDEDSETVSFSAGLRYGELGVALQKSGWALRNLASLPHISVGGAVATGTHGSGDRNGTLSRAVTGLELVTASGELLSITPADAAFDGAVVSLGALGVVHRITLDIEPSYQVVQEAYRGLTWPILTENFERIMARGYSVSVFTDWQSVGTVLIKSRTDAAAPPQALYGSPAARTPLSAISGDPADNMTQQGGVPGAWIDRLPHFQLGFTPSNGEELQTEYIVPAHHALAAIAAVRELADHVTPHLLVTELRSMAADSLWLSGAYETDAVAIHFTWKKRPTEVLALLPVLEAALAPFDARPHWGKLFHTVRRELYPKLSDFVELAEELDPTHKFRNAYLDRNVFG